MPIENATANYGLELPHPSNALSSDVLRLMSALSSIDGLLKALADATSNVTNTSDANKPVSTAQAAAILLKVDKTAPLSDGANLNDVVTSGFYRVGNTPTGAPANAQNGQMLVSRGGDTVCQILFPHMDVGCWYRVGTIGAGAGDFGTMGWRWFGEPKNTSIARDGSGALASVTEDGVTKTITRDGSGQIQSISWPSGNGKTRTITFNRSGENLTGTTTTEA